MEIKKLIEKIENFCPAEIQEEWDNSGWQIRSSKGECKKVLIALEITGEVIDEAINIGADMIITHHPLIFNGLKKIDENDVVGKFAHRLIKAEIDVYSCHTNFDIIFGGNNDFLGNVLAVDMVVPKYSDNNGILRHGWYNESHKLGDLIDFFTYKLGIDKSNFKVVGDLEKDISKVAICTGAGAEFIQEAYDDKCDLLITGDVKYHDARLAKELGIAVIDLGHYATEMIFPEAFLDMLIYNAVDEEIFILSQVDVNPFTNIGRNNK